MVDVLTPEQRSLNMRSIRGRDTKPELVLRRALHAEGYRYRLHRKDLPGSPDIVLVKYRTALFVHGCFWHRHAECSAATTPATNTSFWATKFAANVKRGKSNVAELNRLGWAAMIIWECELSSAERVRGSLKRIRHALGRRLPPRESL